ncbi:MAG: hypothetical protein FD170_89 [Bacteroidetes bacterium]|nr:MAG: hypothetical protein FD170_89 [Bacteroidota bacterium]
MAGNDLIEEYTRISKTTHFYTMRCLFEFLCNKF